MGYDQVTLLNRFNDTMQELKLTLSDTSPIKLQFDSVREFLADRANLPEEEWLAKWNPRFKEYWTSQYVVRVLGDAVVQLKDQGKPLRDTLKKIFAGSLDPDFEPQQAKNAFYELEVAGVCKEAGFTVSLREPDLVIEGNGLSKPVAVACKYPSSRQQLHPHLSKGYQQIANQGLNGFVSIGLDLIVFKEAGLKAFVDFRQSEQHPMKVLLSHLSREMNMLLENRSTDYPEERPIDGLLLTLRPYGIYGEPAQLTLMHAVTLHCNSDNPGIGDFGALYSKLKTLVPHNSGVGVGITFR